MESIANVLEHVGAPPMLLTLLCGRDWAPLMAAAAAQSWAHWLFWELASGATVWLFYYLAVHAIYYVFGHLLHMIIRLVFPEHGSNRVSDSLRAEQIELSERAFPLYCLVPVIGELLRRHGLSRVCNSVEECGGWTNSILQFILYLWIVEWGVFHIHYYWLHMNSWGKRNLNHALHHSFKYADEMCAWSGYAFEAVDGFAQGMPFVVTQLIVPIPYAFYMAAGFLVAIWTLYIHVGEPHLPWPMMGADYHYVHHVYNWYNFGLFTLFWDTMYGTVKALPREEQRKKPASQRSSMAEVMAKKKRK